jgi:hypothetical protein
MSVITPFYKYGNNRLVGGGGSGSSVIVPNTVFVSNLGNNATAIRNRFDKPCQDIATAKTLAQNNDNIVILSDLTNQAVMNDNSKNLHYSVFGKRIISFLGEVFNIATGVTLTIYAPEATFNFTSANISSQSGILDWEFHTINYTNQLNTVNATVKIKGKNASKTGAGFPFIFGKTNNKQEYEIANFNSTGNAISYVTDGGNVTIKNTNFNLLGLLRFNNSPAPILNDILFENSKIIADYLELGTSAFDSFLGQVYFDATQIQSNSVSKNAIEVNHLTGTTNLVFNNDSLIQSAFTYAINNPTGSILNLYLQDILKGNKPLDPTGFNFPISGGAYLESPNLKIK